MFLSAFEEFQASQHLHSNAAMHYDPEGWKRWQQEYTQKWNAARDGEDKGSQYIIVTPES